MTFPYGKAITLVTRAVTGRDVYGNDVYGETTTTVVGAFAPGGSSEQVQGQDTVTTQPTAYLPSGTDPTAIDALEVDGQRYEVDGDPQSWQSPYTGWAPGVAVRLQRVTG